MDVVAVENKMKEYERFLEDTLKKDLSEIQAALHDKVEKHKEWEEVKHVVKTMKEYKEKDRDMIVCIELGSAVRVQGEVNDYERTYINVGLGYILEMDCEEAEKYSQIRTRSLQRDIVHYHKLAVNVKVNIKMVLLALNELQSLVLSRSMNNKVVLKQ